jgi:hypothetical protein
VARADETLFGNLGSVAAYEGVNCRGDYLLSRINVNEILAHSKYSRFGSAIFRVIRRNSSFESPDVR